MVLFYVFDSENEEYNSALDDLSLNQVSPWLSSLQSGIFSFSPYTLAPLPEKHSEGWFPPH